MVPGHIWTQLECHTGLIVSCFPALNRVFRLLKQWVLGTRTQGADAAADGGAELYVVGGESQEQIVDASVEVVVLDCGGKMR